MGRAEQRWLLVAVLGGLPAVFAGYACGAASVEGDDLVVGLPDRVPSPPGADGSAEAASPPPPVDGSVGVDSAVAQVLCDAPDLELCFTFEGKVVDGSSTPLQPTVTGVTFVAGKVGQAALLGPSSAIGFLPSPKLEVTTATIEAWVKVAPGATVDGVIFDDDGRASLTINPDGSVLCKPGLVTGTTKVIVDQWTHVACVFDGARAHVYVAGVEVGVAGNAAIGPNPTLGAALGGNSPSGEPFVGAIDSFRFFRVARTAAQIATAAGK